MSQSVCYTHGMMFPSILILIEYYVLRAKRRRERSRLMDHLHFDVRVRQAGFTVIGTVQSVNGSLDDQCTREMIYSVHSDSDEALTIAAWLNAGGSTQRAILTVSASRDCLDPAAVLSHVRPGTVLGADYSGPVTVNAPEAERVIG